MKSGLEAVFRWWQSMFLIHKYLYLYIHGETVFVFKLVFVFEYSMDVGRWQSELLIGRRGTNVAANRAQLGRPIETNSDQNQLKPNPIQTNSNQLGQTRGKRWFLRANSLLRGENCVLYSRVGKRYIFAILAPWWWDENSVLDFYIYHEGHLLFPSVGQTVIRQIPRLIFCNDWYDLWPGQPRGNSDQNHNYRSTFCNLAVFSLMVLKLLELQCFYFI